MVELIVVGFTRMLVKCQKCYVLLLVCSVPDVSSIVARVAKLLLKFTAANETPTLAYMYNTVVVKKPVFIS